MDFNSETQEQKIQNYEQQSANIINTIETFNKQEGVRGEINYFIRKSRYYGATNEGTAEPRKYERDNLLTQEER